MSLKWHSLSLSLCDDNYRSNWPDFITDEQVRALADSFAEKGLLDVFYREFRNLPIAKETASFHQEYFHQYEETEEYLNISPLIENVVLVDPAKTVQLQSDFSGIVGVGVDVIKNRIKVRDCVGLRLFPDELYEETFAMAARINAKVIAVEVTSLHEFITFPLRNWMMSKCDHFYEIVELHARKSKLERIGSLSPFYRTGQIEHNRKACRLLEEQLLSHPKSRRDDLADALAYIIALMEEGQRYFQPTAEQAKNEFADLKYDVPEPNLGRII